MSKNGEQEEFDMCLALRELKEEGRVDILILMTEIVKTLREGVLLSDEDIAERCECTVAEVQAIRKAFEMWREISP